MRQQEAEQEAARRNAEDERRDRFVFYALDHSAGMSEGAWEVEMRLRTVSLKQLIGAVMGSVLGIIGSFLISLILRDSLGPGSTQSYLKIMIMLLMTYVGLIVGALGRLLHPGRDPMGWLLTLAIGVVSMLIAAIISSGWIAFVIGVIVAMFTLGTAVGFGRERISQVTGGSLPSIAGILLIVAAGGGFKQVLVDSGISGLIADAALLAAERLVPGVAARCVAGHRSVEPGAAAVLGELGLEPVLDLDLRLGEGSGACLALPIVEAAARILAEMATFDAAGVTDKEP